MMCSRARRLAAALSALCPLLCAPAAADLADPGFTRVSPAPNAIWGLIKSPAAASGAPAPSQDCSTTANNSGCSVVLTNGGNAGQSGDKVFVANVPVTGGQTYTFSFYMKTDSFPQSLLHAFAEFPGFSHPELHSDFAVQSVTAIDQWQKGVLVFTAPANAVTMDLYIELGRKVSTSNFWVSDAHLSEGVALSRSEAAPKVPFQGSRVKVDALGNFQVFKDNAWSNFFPICIFADNTRVDTRPGKSKFAIYAEQGFNCNMWAGYPDAVRWGAEAGMMSGYQISDYISPLNLNNHYNKPLDNIAAINASDYADQLLFYYWDNENDQLLEWAVPDQIAQIIDSTDRDGQHHRMRPIYMLQAHPGVVRKYNTGSVSGTLGSMSDIVGTYLRELNQPRARGWGHYLLETLPEQKQPVVIAQLNADLGYGGDRFVAAVYTALARGAKGIGFWKDCYSCGATPDPTHQARAVEHYAWWNELPRLAATIHSQIDVLRTPHWGGWTLSSTSAVEYGTRFYDGRGYFIVSNESANPMDAGFSIDNLGYAPLFARNAYTGEVEANVRNGDFILPIAANQGGIYELSADIRDALVLNLRFGGDLDDASPFGNDATLVGAGSVSGANTLALSGGYLEVAGATAPTDTSLEMNKTDLTLLVRARIVNEGNDPVALIGKGDEGDLYGLVYIGGALQFLFGNAENTQWLSSSAGLNISDGQWHTLAVSVDRAGLATFYKDGQPVGAQDASALAGSAIADTGEPLQVGAWAGEYRLQGEFDNVRVYKAALSGADIGRLSSNVLAIGLQDTGEPRVDESLFGNDISSASFVWNGSAANGAIGFKPDDLNNTHRKIQVRNNDGLEFDPNTDLSISARVQFDNTGGYVGIVSKGATAPQIAGYALMYDVAAQKLGFWPGDGSDRGYYNSDVVVLNDGDPHDVAVTFSRGAQEVNFYVDGVSVGSVAVPLSFAGADFTNGAEMLSLGSWGQGNRLEGTISNVFVDRRVITATEIQQRHQLPPGP